MTVSPRLTTWRLWKKSSSRSVVMLPEGARKLAQSADSIGILNPGRHDAGQGAAVRHDDLVLARVPQDLVHGCVDALRPRRLGLCTLHALVVVHPFPDSRRWDEALVEPLLRPSLRFAVGLLPKPAIQDWLHAEQFGHLLGRPQGALQFRGEQLHLGIVRNLGQQRLGDGNRRTDAGGRQLRVMPSADTDNLATNRHPHPYSCYPGTQTGPSDIRASGKTAKNSPVRSKDGSCTLTPTSACRGGRGPHGAVR